jgi:DNA-3-methyladenine glycosylase
MSSCEFRLKRVYGERSRSDGFRVLVDRVWPRGVSKEEAASDLWLKDIAPSADLRKWFGHDPKRWDGFVKKYRQELDRNETAVDQILELAKEHPVVTLLFGAKDEEHNQAVALRDYLQERRG